MRREFIDLLPDVALFVAVGRTKNFSKAARALGLPVSTLSRRVAGFERKLGVQLLVRSTRQVTFTDLGARYFERCQLVIETAESAQAELEGQTEHPSGKLRISATQDFALSRLADIFDEFSTRHPEISFELDLTPRSVDLIGEGIDVAIRMGNLPDSQLFARSLGSGSVGLYAASAYLERAGRLASPADLARHECLRIQGKSEAPNRWSLTRGSQVEEVDVKGRFIANGMRFLCELATRGLGIAPIDDAIALASLESGRLVRVLPEWSLPAVPVHALTASKVLPARTRVFLECLSDHLRLGGRAPARALR